MKQRFRWGLAIICLLLILIRQLYPNALNLLQVVQFDAFNITLLLIIIITIFLPLIRSLLEHLNRLHKKWIVILLCVVLVITRIFFPATQIDIISIWLIGIASLLFILPDIKSLTPYVKRIKIGDAEVELKESIGNLQKEVEKAEDIASEETLASNSNNISSEIEQVLQETSKDPRAALLLISSKIEEQLRQRLEEADIPTGQFSINRYVDIGVRRGIFPKEFLPAFRDFWAVRNKVAHGAAFDIDDSYIFSLISLGTQLLKIASVSRKQDKPNSDE